MLDGRNRLRACEAAGLQPVFEELDESVDPWLYVLSQNYHRRHLAPHEKGRILRAVLDAKGVKRGSGARNDRTSDTVSEVASALGVNERTLRRQVKAADEWDTLPEDLQVDVGGGAGSP